MDDKTQSTVRRLSAELRELLGVVRVGTCVSLDEWRTDRLTLLAEVSSFVDSNVTILNRHDLDLLEAILLEAFEVLKGLALPTDIGTKLAALRTLYEGERGRLFPIQLRSLEQIERDYSAPVRTPTRLFRARQRGLEQIDFDDSPGRYRVH